MPFPKSKFAKISSILAALVFIILISLSIASEAIISGEIRGYIKGISEDTGYKIEIKDIGFGFFSGLTGNEIEIFDAPNLAHPILRIKSLAARPEILSSIINQKVKIREIIIDNSAVSLTKEELDNLVRLVKEKIEEGKRKKGKPIPVEIERLLITDSRIEIAPLNLIYLKKIEADLGNAGLDEKRTVRFSGLANLKNNDIEIQGEIKPFLNTPTGELKVSASELNTRSFAHTALLPEKMSVSLDSKFQISDEVTSHGIINFNPAQGGEKNPLFSGKLNYDLAYDKSTDTAFVNSLNLDLNNEIIRASFSGCIENLTKEGIFNIRGKAETVRLEDITKRFPDLSQVELSGDAKPDNVKITGSMRDKNISITGNINLREVSVKDKNGGFQITGLRGGFNFNQNFGDSAPKDFISQGNFSLRSISTKVFNVKGVSGSVQFVPSGNGIRFKSEKLSYGNFLLFEKALVENGDVNRFEFNIGENGNWTLDLSSDGSRLKMPDEEVYLSRFQTGVHIREGEKIDAWGRLSGRGGRYKDISFPAVSADFRFRDDSINLTNLKAAVEDYGELRTENLNLLIGDRKPYTLVFTKGSFSGFNGGVRSKGIRGKFRFNPVDGKRPTWDGNVFIPESDIFKSRIENLSFHVSPTSNGINLEKISGGFPGGDLRGNAQIKTSESPAFIFSDIEIKNINLNNAASLETLNLRFGGRLERGALPQGSGEIIGRLELRQDGAASSLKGRIGIKTIGETLILKDGFIEDERGASLKFTGKMESSLDSSRRLRLDFPEIPLASIREILYPILPQTLREGKVRGNTSLNLALASSPKEEMLWDGKLSLRGVSFDGRLSSGVNFLIRDLNGTIHLIEDEKGLEDRLNFSIVGYAKPDEKAFEMFLNALSRDRLEHGEDILRIKEIEYGFLRLEDIEFALEVSRGRLNLRRFESKIYDGSVFGAGLFEFGKEERKCNFSFLVKDLSLEKASDSIPSTKDYVTGRMNGIGWLSDDAGKLSTLDGAFNFWTIKSKKEPRTIGRALLTQLGVKEKFLLRSSRKYDEGQMYGYIRDGVIIFKGLKISHTILGIRDLFIRVDSKRNSISVSHLLSVIRETAKRASEGRLKIEFENK